MAPLNSIVDREGNAFDVGCNYGMPLFRDPRIDNEDIQFFPCCGEFLFEEYLSTISLYNSMERM
jgi:hypothetical protein